MRQVSSFGWMDGKGQTDTSTLLNENDTVTQLF